MVEKRRHRRRELEDLAAPLYNEDRSQEIDYSPVNVSPTGMGIFVARHIPVDSELYLALDDQDVRLLVVWCVPKEDDVGIFRCGLEVMEKSVDLEELIKKSLWTED